MRKIAILVIVPLLLAALMLTAKTPTVDKVHWISVNELDALYAKEPRPIIFDVYTSWCGWCKVMDKKTYSDEKLAAYVNSKFYAVKFDAESAETVSFNKKKYGFDKATTSNTLALYLLSGRMEFPTTVFLQTPDAAPAAIAGYLTPSQIEPSLKYFGEKASLSMPFEAFRKQFKAEW